MTADRPSWIHPGFRLIDGEGTFGWSELAALPIPAGGVVFGNRVSTVVAALAAAQRDDTPLRLARHGEASMDPSARTGFSVTLESSGTTGTPKRITHNFSRLSDRLKGLSDVGARWLLTYEPAAFAGLQVILTAAAAGALLVSVPGGGVAELVRAARQHAVTHVSGTPSFWRGFLMAAGDAVPPLRSVTLGGEAADQPLLDRLRQTFPEARLRHIYASTEAGALFAVADGRAGFPAEWLSEGRDGVALRIRDGVLEVRSPRAMLAAPGTGDGWLDTGDLVEVAGDRVLFAGRRDGLVNVGGVKVSPEAVEQRLLAVPGVADAAVVPVANPITGFLLTATVVPAPGGDEAALRAALRAATADLVPAARPRVLTLAAHIPLGATGKKSRKGSP
ncbi:AMP-binding protein [Azospirillum doebereinerae]|uniref:AMP-binding protein n=2 Tax=Azospirillum doebereinerae TaxID=92933 RepID=UPI00384EA2AA